MREFEKNIRKVEPYVPGEQPKKEHQNIYKILDAIIKYRHGMR